MTFEVYSTKTNDLLVRIESDDVNTIHIHDFFAEPLKRIPTASCFETQNPKEQARIFKKAKAVSKEDGKLYVTALKMHWKVLCGTHPEAFRYEEKNSTQKV